MNRTITTAEATVAAIRAALAPLAEREVELTTYAREMKTARDAACAALPAASFARSEVATTLHGPMQRAERERDAVMAVTGKLGMAITRIEGGGRYGKVDLCRDCGHQAQVTLSFSWGDGAVCQWCEVAPLIGE